MRKVEEMKKKYLIWNLYLFFFATSTPVSSHPKKNRVNLKRHHERAICLHCHCNGYCSFGSLVLLLQRIQAGAQIDGGLVPVPGRLLFSNASTQAHIHMYKSTYKRNKRSCQCRRANACTTPRVDASVNLSMHQRCRRPLLPKCMLP